MDDNDKIEDVLDEEDEIHRELALDDNPTPTRGTRELVALEKLLFDPKTGQFNEVAVQQYLEAEAPIGALINDMRDLSLTGNDKVRLKALENLLSMKGQHNKDKLTVNIDARKGNSANADDLSNMLTRISEEHPDGKEAEAPPPSPAQAQAEAGAEAGA